MSERRPALTPEGIRGKLLAERPASGTPQALADPASETPMRITLEQLRPYEHNPRLIRNPQYEALKASIRTRGLDQPPPITRRPGDTHFIIRNGGNTRLAILNELWQETRDERFFHIHCLFRPWTEEIEVLLGHMAENDLHSPLSFIERALSVARVKALLEQDGPPLSQNELARRLTAGGYPISQPHVSRMLDSLAHLLPAIPQTLYAGLGKPQIQRLLTLRRQALKVWARYPPPAIGFDELWLTVLACHDQPGQFDPAQFRGELLASLSRTLGRPMARLDRQLEDPEALSAEDEADSATTPPITPSDRVISVTDEAGRTDPPRSRPPDESQSRVARIRQQIIQESGEAETTELVTGEVWSLPSPPADPTTLRRAIAHLARSLACEAGQPDSVAPCDHGLGFACRPDQALDTPEAVTLNLLLGALLGSLDALAWEDRRHLPAVLFGRLLLGALPDDPSLVRLSDRQLLDLFRLIRLARRLLELTAPAPDREPRP